MSLRYGRYETIAQIASGGMATVYLGRAVGVGGFERKVAIKVMHDHIADDPDFVAMFLDEARLAARIHHPNVVGTMDVQKTEDAMFLVMEYIEGCSLRRALRGCRRADMVMPLDISLRVMVDTLRGLHAAHELSSRDGQPLMLVHRDISPHNILIGIDGISRITDFGVARAEARLSSTRGGQLKGKIAYMPPEQGRGEDIDRRADVYAAGVVFWEMLTGRRLFEAEHDGALVAQILTGCTTTPREANEEVPAPIDAVCMKALSIPVADRYASAAEFAEALEDAAHELGIRLASPSRVTDFIDEFKVVIDTKRPPPMDEDSVEGRPIEIDSPITGSGVIDEPSSQLSGIGAVHSVQMLRPSQAGAAPRKRWALAAVVAAGVFVVGVVVIASSSSSSTSPAAGPPTTAEPADPPKPEPEPAKEEPTAEASATATATATAAATASASADDDAKKADEAKADKAKGGGGAGKPKVGGTPRPRVPRPRTGKDPYGFEPDDL